jgi:hypothetical protein
MLISRLRAPPALARWGSGVERTDRDGSGALLNVKQPVSTPRGLKLIGSAPALRRRERNSLPRNAKSETIAFTDPGIRRMSAEMQQFPLPRQGN